jgi:ABC-type lipoprotein export system ATPase subunit
MDERQLAATRLSTLGFVFQFHFLLPGFTARRNVEIPMRRLGRLTQEQIHERAADLLASLGLASISTSARISFRADSVSASRSLARLLTTRH